MHNRNKKSDNFSDIILSKKRETQADVGEIFLSRDNSFLPTVKRGINNFFRFASQAALNLLDQRVTVLEQSPGGSVGTTVVITVTPTATNYDDGRPSVASGISAMGATPIQLLPAPGANRYYDIEKIILEFTHVITPYISTDLTIYFDDGTSVSIPSNIITRADNNFVKIDTNFLIYSILNEKIFSQVSLPSVGLVLSTESAIDPTLGDGTLRIVITYTKRTFGA